LYSEDSIHSNISDAPPAEEPPADDADTGRSAGLSVQGAFDTLAAYIVGLHSLVEVYAE
jgi:shikimate kinase